MSNFNSALDNFIAQLYADDMINNADDSLDLIFETIDQLIVKQQYKYCDKLLVQTDVSKLDIPVMLGFLSCTFLIKEHLVQRSAYIEKVRTELSKRLPAREVHQLLNRLC